MRTYDNLLSTIEAYFSAEVGASEESVTVFERMLEEDGAWRQNLREELQASLSDADFSWKRALWDEYCHVSNEDSEEAARDYVRENILRRIDKAHVPPAP